ncbi:Tyrosyl-DNA phosphodiesterase 1 [Camellia lanceoleosa]|nr:Tyrosyl-DNA phosphodiesterase 1 [Camellia lanceoleosa]
MNGVFVNGVRIVGGQVAELGAGDEVLVVCGNEGVCSLGVRIGFVVQRIVFVEEVFNGTVSNFCENGCGRVVASVNLLLSGCRQILHSNDPILSIRKCDFSHRVNSILGLMLSNVGKFPVGGVSELRGGNLVEPPSGEDSRADQRLENLSSTIRDREATVVYEANAASECYKVNGNHLQQMEHAGAPLPSNVTNGKPKTLCLDSAVKDNGLPLQQMEHVGAPLAHGVANGKPKPLCLDSIVKDSGLPLQQMEHFGAPLASSVASGKPNPLCLDSTVKDNGLPLQQMEQFGAPLASSVPNGKPKTLYLDSMVKENTLQFHWGAHDENQIGSIPPPGKKFYLNRLQTMGHGSLDHHDVVSLPELLYPVESLSQIFIATFTSDILWFLLYCDIPAHLPVTIACHNHEGCWCSSPDKRISVPFSDFPNLVVVYPPFPEVIAFGNDCKRSGIACHHPKLLVLQREESISVVITSANLVEKQWNSVTNTIWWQDFPRTSRPDYLSLSTQLSDGDINQYSKSDFAAQLGGFMASLVADVPSQAHWILELTKYDFKGAVGHLVASVPGIHSRRAPSILEPMYFLPGEQCASQSYGVKVLGSIETSVVGLSHLFRTSADTDGSQLKKLASVLGKCYENANGMLEIVLRRNTNIPADANAVSILVPNPEEFSEGDCIQLGFLPRNVAKWVALLSNSGLFRFSGYVYPKEVLVIALEGSTNLVQMILYVSQGPAFSDISKVVQSEHVSTICLLVLSHYKWPEYLETDFVFVHFQRSRMTSVQFSESDESNPDWGCWSASQEIRNASIRIIFPTIERVKNASCGILASKFLLYSLIYSCLIINCLFFTSIFLLTRNLLNACFLQKTWQRLRNVGMLHDVIPYPNNRVNHPMHVKVARRRFQSKKDASSFGWVYSGSHNFSAAAWGRPISNSLRTKAVGAVKTNSVLGSRLHVCNYELGIVFIVPPSDVNGSPNHKSGSLDDIILPFVVPAPKYRPSDSPATK